MPHLRAPVNPGSLICIDDKSKSAQVFAMRRSREGALRFADPRPRRTAGGGLAARLTLFLVFSVPRLPAQAPPASPAPRPAPHQIGEPQRAAAAEGSVATVVASVWRRAV